MPCQLDRSQGAAVAMDWQRCGRMLGCMEGYMCERRQRPATCQAMLVLCAMQAFVVAPLQAHHLGHWVIWTCFPLFPHEGSCVWLY